jgi:hypothetical protein
VLFALLALGGVLVITGAASLTFAVSAVSLWRQGRV